jgi:serine/threonine protein kinase
VSFSHCPLQASPTPIVASYRREYAPEVPPALPEKPTSSSTSRRESLPLGAKPSMDDFVLLKVLGKGSFGKVMQVRLKATGKIYAMKVLHKKHIMERKQVENTMAEKEILAKANHPFIVGLKASFQTEDKLYFVLDFCAGGELFFHLGRDGRFYEGRARFYTAEILLALRHLHSIGVVYRDLKPENILLDENGNVKLTDFGLSKRGVTASAHGATSFCGTPEYLPPEVVGRQEYGNAADWWGLGALLHEMLTGWPPFYDEDRKNMFRRILREPLKLPEELSPAARGLLSRLLVKDPRMRLGATGGADEIMRDPFFDGVDWHKLETLQIPAPWRPDLAGADDASCFDREFTSRPAILSPPDASPAAALVEGATRATERPAHAPTAAGFDGFSYVAPASSMLSATPMAVTRASAERVARAASGHISASSSSLQGSLGRAPMGYGSSSAAALHA